MLNFNKNLIFDEELKIIRFNFPSVSKLLNLIYPFPINEIPAQYLELGINKGICIHERINEFLENGWDIGCNHNIKTHQKNWENWLKFWNKKDWSEYKIYSEFIFINEKQKYLGIIDFLAIKKDESKILIYEWKTTSELKPENEAFQLKAYKTAIMNEMSYIDPLKCEIWVFNTNKNKEYQINLEQELLAEEKLKESLKLWKK